MAEEAQGHVFPVEFEGAGARLRTRDSQRHASGGGEVFMERTAVGSADHVEGPRGRVRSDRSPAASASSMTRPKVSVRLGKTKESAAL